MKTLFYDIETTGTNPRKNGLHQIAGILEVSGEIVEEFNFNVKPNPLAVIEEEALKIAGVTREQIEAYPDMSEVHGWLIDILSRHVNKFDKADKIHLAGYNNRAFDDQFLRAWFKQNGDKYFGSWFWSDSLDVLVLASNKLRKKRAMLPNFKLHTVAREFGLEVDDTQLHDALYDIKLTRNIYHKL